MRSNSSAQPLRASRTCGARRRGLAVVAGVVVTLAPLALSPSALAAGPLSGKYQTRIASGQLKGTWTISFVPNGTYTVKRPFPGLVRGKDTFSGSTVTFNHEGTSPDGTCNQKPGKYRFTVTGKTLKLTLISDSCVGRRAVLSHKLTNVG
jgi:hypothetical protein